MTNKQEIVKNRKYMFQFPEGTDSEQQKKYLNKVNEAFNSADIVAIDPKVKVYDRQEYLKEENESTNTNTGKDTSNTTNTEGQSKTDGHESDKQPSNGTPDSNENTNDATGDEKPTGDTGEPKPTGEKNTEAPKSDETKVERVEPTPKPEDDSKAAETIYFGNEE